MNYIVIYYDGDQLRATKVDLSLWPISMYPDGLDTCLDVLALPPQSTISAVVSNSSGREHVVIFSEEEDYSSGMNRAYELGHILYETCDPDKPDAIVDRNGDVVLGLCRRCGKGEIELSEPCIPCPPPGESPH